ncbi:iron complex outermembrane recepter protein [Pseudomonas flavescens]|uniref:Iron complex outermembrane recepter protein n=1 Tax=Phytopseudomonas flavescens TaxID=29435 RepID=A0A1G8PI66_9GAMM|nr:TonB-dependent receptor [Pseudomonas flavescens]SDI92137.1 iron complex outermembrane recepter protein [Pseudomonas flavescens]
MRPTRSPLLPALAAAHLLFAATSASALEFDLPAQRLDAALTDFAEQANVRLLYDASLTRGDHQAPALKGDYSLAEGLQRLLQGSGLSYQIDPQGTVSLVPLGQGDDSLQLGATTVSGQADGRLDLPVAYAGGQVARGARIGMLGNQDMQDVPFSAASYTGELIENRQARSLGEVLASDPAIRQSNGFGNFSQVFVVRGFQLYSDEIAFNGLYGILPRQIISTEAVERVEVFKGANAFLNGVAPGGSGVGGTINVISKRAEDTPNRSITLDYASDSRVGGHIDLGRRFGEDNRFGVRVNLAKRDGEAAVDGEHSHFSLAAVGLDYRSDRLRVSTDFGYQKQRINEGRAVINLAASTTGLGGKLPKAPDSDANYAQPWSWSQLEDTYGMFNAEYDLSDNWTAYLAGGGKYTRENGVYSSLFLASSNGDGRVGRLYSPLDQETLSSVGGLRGRVQTGAISHQLNFAVNGLWQEKRNAFESTTAANRLPGNLYDPFPSPEPIPSVSGDIHDPRKTAKLTTRSAAVSDTLGFMDDRLLLTLGLRRQSLTSDSWSASTGARGTPYDKSITTPAYGVVFKATDVVSLYANRIESLQQGPTAPTAAVNNAGQTFAPYRSKQIEAGVKLDWGTFGGSLGVYRIEQPQGITQGGTFSVDAEQRNRGVELNLFGEPVSGVRVLAGATWMDTELRGTAGGTNDGNRAVGVPQFQFNVGADWDVPGVPGLSLNSLLLRTGGQYIDSANDLSIPAWTRVDLGARYGMKLDEERNLTLRAGLENVADKAYWASTNGGYLTQGEPRTLKVSATLDF